MIGLAVAYLVTAGQSFQVSTQLHMPFTKLRLVMQHSSFHGVQAYSRCYNLQLSCTMSPFRQHLELVNLKDAICAILCASSTPSPSGLTAALNKLSTYIRLTP